MPSFSSPSSIRVASHNHVLRLKITHNLVYGAPSDVVHSVIKGRLPKEMDVLWLSDIFISLSGVLDGHQIPAGDIVRSGLVHHLQTQLNANADRLGLNNVSRPFVDDADGLSKLTLTPSRPLPDASRPHADLVSLHLAYIWTTVAGRSDTASSGHLIEDFNPFSPTLFLPAEALLNRVTEQFLINHLVSRYPLIFGPWCKRLDLEMQHFASIGQSIVEIMNRSNNPTFVSKCKRLLKIARRQHKFVLETATAALSSCIDDAGTSGDEMDQVLARPVLTDERVVCESLEQLFRMGVPKRRFKPAARDTPQTTSIARDGDDDTLIQSLPDVEIDDAPLWSDLPEIAVSTCGRVADDYETLPEDMVIFTQEDWSEGGMWRQAHREEDAGQGERKFDTPSDESLISGSIWITDPTRVSQVYHEQDVDDGEVDPAAGGLGYKVSQLALVEDAETSGVLVDFAPEAHDQYYSKNCEQVMVWQVDLEGFESLEGLSDREEGEWLLFEDEPLV